MRWLLHGSTKTKRVPGGRVLHQRCPECHADTTFHEVEVTTSAGAFFIDVLSSTDRAFRCASCDETFDLKDDDQPVRETETVRPPRDLAAELAAEKQRRAAVAATRDKQVDDELAALKRKLGK